MENTKIPNRFRITYNDNFFKIDFGSQKHENDDIKILHEITVLDENMRELLEKIFYNMIKYEYDTGKNIGAFPFIDDFLNLVKKHAEESEK